MYCLSHLRGIIVAQLVIITGSDPNLKDKSFAIRDGDTIGSNVTNTIVFNSPEILPQHIKFQINENHTQLYSNTPILVNNEVVTKCNLVHGDMIVIHDFVLMWKDDAADQQIAKPAENILQSRIESRHRYYDSTKHIIDSLGDHEKSQLRLITLYKISSAIGGIFDLDELLKNLLKIILSEFGADRGFIMLYNPHSQKLVPRAAITDKGDIITPKISERIVQEVFSTKESLLCENVLEDARFCAQDSLIKQNVMATMCIPLIRNGEILGILHIDSHQRGKFSQSDLDLLTKVATQASIVIENARFYKSKQDFNRNLLSLAQATQSLSVYLRSDLIIEDATKYACKIFDCNVSVLFLGSKESLKLAYAQGIPHESWQQIVIPETFKNVVQNNSPILLNKHNLANIYQIIPKGESLIAVPMAVHPEQQSNIMGLLCVGKRAEGGVFSSEDQQLLMLLASYTASALSNASFYEELKHKEQEIAQWNQQLEKRIASRSEELRITQNKLIQSEKMAAVGLLAAGVSHEFNNIIAGMYGFAQMASKNEKYKDRLIQVVIEQSKRACQITESLQSFSKQRGEINELADMCELIETVLRLSETALANEGIKIIKQYNTLPKLLVNITKMQQVIVNILVNARHAIEKDGTITIRTYTSNDSQTAYIDFEDDGKGIDPDKLNRIFEPFYTTKGSFGSGTQPGTGVGLSVCYNIIKAHGGDISVRSQLGLGTCFTISLPVPPQNNIVTDEIYNARQEKWGNGQRILVFEDSNDVRKQLVQILTDKGFLVYPVDNASAAIELCKKELFDYIFLNIGIPGCQDNFEIFKEVTRLEPNTKIILLTGRVEDAAFMRYVGLGHGYLRKPFDIADIYRIFHPKAKT